MYIYIYSSICFSDTSSTQQNPGMRICHACAVSGLCASTLCTDYWTRLNSMLIDIDRTTKSSRKASSRKPDAPCTAPLLTLQT